ncbi:ABC transporter permease [Chitinophaga filiformis]|uniref:FtsX-like permease family protein n=1 Tax=Chitinophaga filiformis TaxID=104663 RepID=A0A1G7NWS7_CHIFI|nr:ABC transporter permease [Chitinophaga filiformis]SDF77660.1 FtsX-like permease family protein [Chitinophaga filiformis]
MLKNYFRIAYRNLFKNKVHSLINITGLSLGMAAAILLLLNIQYGLSIDQFHEKKANIYKAYTKGIVNGKLSCWEFTAGPLGPALKNYPDVRNMARTIVTNKLLRHEDKLIPAVGNITDAAFLSMFSFPLIAGNMQTALKHPNNIVITQQLAVKLFGSQDPVNKILNTPTGDIFTVTGVLKDLPANTQFKFDYLLPWEYLHSNGAWNNQNLFTYIELQPNANIDVVNQKIAHVGQQNSSLTVSSLPGQTTFLYPLAKVYLENRFENGRPAGGNIDNLKMLGGLMAVILLIACINFMNLSTARSEKRAKEVGIRKVVGAARRSLVIQFIGESVLMAFLAGIIALVLVQLVLPYFSDLTRAQLSIPWKSPLFWLAALAFILLTGLMAGSYPALYLSSYKPVKVLKGILQNGNALVTPRKILVVVQFTFSIVLINFTFIYHKQIQHQLNREVGFAKETLVYHSLTADLRHNYTALKNELIGTGIASSVSESNARVTQIAAIESGLKWDGMDPKINPGFVLIMENGGLVQTNGLSLVAGRDIDIENYPGDTLSCVINAASAKVLGFKDPVGQIIRDEDVPWTIVGVVKDFLVGDPDQASQPVLIKGTVNPGNTINIRISGGQSFFQNIQRAEAILKKYNPGYLTELQFADSDYAAKFQHARNIAMLISTFTFIAIFISCMGLLGLATYMTENRVREIGIRKVLGSSVTGIVSLLTRDFVRLILIAILLASPLAWFFMHSFLERFSYRTSLDGWVLAVTGAATLSMALLTISFQVMRAALMNPVKNLRTE